MVSIVQDEKEATVFVRRMEGKTFIDRSVREGKSIEPQRIPNQSSARTVLPRDLRQEVLPIAFRIKDVARSWLSSAVPRTILFFSLSVREPVFFFRSSKRSVGDSYVVPLRQRYLFSSLSLGFAPILPPGESRAHLDRRLTHIDQGPT